jgi:dTMP kinase
MTRGAFIVFEGVDRCGKTTQCRKLVEALKTRLPKDTEFMCYPNRASATGKLINEYLTQKAEMDDHAVHLLFSANRWEQVSYIRERLNAGVTIVCDRYAYSGVAFSAAKGLDANWCVQPDRMLPAPDRVYFMDLPINQASQRGNFGAERYERPEFLQKVYNIFLKIQDEAFQTIDASRTIDAIHEEILADAQCVIDDCSKGQRPMRLLWQESPQIQL